MQNQSKIIAFLTAFVITSGSVFQVLAQQPPQQPPPQQQPQPNIEVSEKEFQKFVEVAAELQEFQSKLQEKQQDILEEHGLDQQEYNKLMQARHNPEAAEEVSEEKLEVFEQASEELSGLQQDQQQAMQEILADAGLSIQEFQQIQQGIQQDPELIERYQQEIRNY